MAAAIAQARAFRDFTRGLLPGRWGARRFTLAQNNDGCDDFSTALESVAISCTATPDMPDLHPQVLHVETPTHGRVLYDDTAGSTAGLIVVLHGYGQSAADAFADVRLIPGIERWRVVAPQALHRFYTRDHQKVVASWMTREDREKAIADNIEYVGRVIDRVGAGGAPIVFTGFSQGASMAYRAALLGRHPAAAVIALGGDIPPEVRARAETGGATAPWPAVPDRRGCS